jgi:uncharacterized protein YhaN
VTVLALPEIQLQKKITIFLPLARLPFRTAIKNQNNMIWKNGEEEREDFMERGLKWILPLILLTVFVSRCDKDNSVAPQDTVDSYEEILAINQEIEDLDKQVQGDPSETHRGMFFRWALRKLDRLLARASRIVGASDNEEARELLDQAFQARERALDAAAEEDWETAFDALRESAYLAVEAVKMVREEHREELEARLEQAFQEVGELLDQVGQLVDEDEGEHPWAAHLYDRAQYHYSMAETEAEYGHPYRALHHLNRARFLANLARLILENAD